MPIDPPAVATSAAEVPEIYELALCESEMLCLRPDTLYRFVVMPGCARCGQLAQFARIE